MRLTWKRWVSGAVVGSPVGVCVMIARSLAGADPTQARRASLSHIHPQLLTPIRVCSTCTNKAPQVRPQGWPAHSQGNTSSLDTAVASTQGRTGYYTWSTRRKVLSATP